MKTSNEIPGTHRRLKPNWIYSIFTVKICVISFFIAFGDLAAQPELLFYTDLGKNNVSNDLYIKLAVMKNFRHGKNIVGTGIQFDLKNYNGSRFSGLLINAAREFTLKNTHLELHGFFIKTNYSKIFGEVNYGCYLMTNLNHFELMMGTSFRTYILTPNETSDNKNDFIISKFHEDLNIIYSINCFIKTPDEKWNAGLTLTNMDYFAINQEFNPVMMAHGSYKIVPSISLSAQVWYMTAGAINLKINHFGYLFRTGMIWNF